MQWMDEFKKHILSFRLIIKTLRMLLKLFHVQYVLLYFYALASGISLEALYMC